MLRLLRPSYRFFLEEFVFGTALGLGLLGYLVLGLGLLGYASKAAVLILLAVLTLASWNRICHLGKSIAKGVRDLYSPGFRPVSIALICFLILIGSLALIGALTPASGNDWDGLSYHLAVPKLYLQAGQIFHIPWTHQSNFPFTWEMLYLVGLSLQGQALAKLFHYLAGILVCLGIFALGKAYWDSRVGLLAAGIFASIPLVGWESTIAYSELAFTLYCFLAIYAFLNWSQGRSFGSAPPRYDRGGGQDKSGGWLWISAICCGLALGCKMLAMIVVILLASGVVWHLTASERSAARSTLRQLAQFLLVAALVASPWYLKSYLWTGNPVYPFFYDWFDGKYWSQALAEGYRGNQEAFGMGHGPLHLLLVPWNLTMYHFRFFDDPSHPVLFSSLGPLFLALLPGLFFLGKLRPAAKFLLLYAAGFLLLWFVTMQQVRYALPVLAALSLVAAASAWGLAEASRALKAAVALACSLAFAIGLTILFLLSYQPLTVVMGQESQDQYLAQTLDVYPILRYVNENLPPNAKIIFFGETRGFYCEREYLWGDHSELIRYDEFDNSNQMLRRFSQLGITHVLITRTFLSSVESAESGSSPLARLLKQTLDNGQLVLLAERKQKVLFLIQYSSTQ